VTAATQPAGGVPPPAGSALSIRASWKAGRAEAAHDEQVELAAKLTPAEQQDLAANRAERDRWQHGEDEWARRAQAIEDELGDEPLGVDEVPRREQEIERLQFELEARGEGAHNADLLGEMDQHRAFIGKVQERQECLRHRDTCRAQKAVYQAQIDSLEGAPAARRDDCMERARQAKASQKSWDINEKAWAPAGKALAAFSKGFGGFGAAEHRNDAAQLDNDSKQANIFAQAARGQADAAAQSMETMKSEWQTAFDKLAAILQSTQDVNRQLMA
jgi:hypothetical protein